MASERWLPVVGYEQHYEVSDLGRVRGIGASTRGRVLSPSKTPAGYPVVSLSRSGKVSYKAIHVLMCEAFYGVPPSEPRPCVNHKDGNRSNNVLPNLEWTTYSGNRRHALDVLGGKPPKFPIIHGEAHYAARLNARQIRIIRHAARLGVSQSFIASLFGLLQGGVSNIVRGRHWKHVPMVEA